MLAFRLSDDQQALREEILAFARQELVPGVGSPYFERDRWEACGRIGLPGLSIPRAYGGRGLGALDTLIALETLGYAHPDNGLNFALSAHLLACVVPLWLFGSERLRQEYLPGLCDGSRIAANAMSEPGSGSDAFSMRTQAVPHEDRYVVTGTKTFVSNGPVADQVLLYAATDPDRGFLGGISAFWLDRQHHTFEKGPVIEKAGLTTSPLGSLYFQHMEVGREFMVGGEGKGAHLFNRSMEWERVCLGGGHLGNIQRLLEKATELLRTRIRSGTERHALQAASHQLAAWQSQWEAARLLAYSAAWKMDEGRPATREAAMSKWCISELYKEVTLGISLLFRGSGIVDPDVEQSHMDALASTLYSGTSEMQLTIIAQTMGL